MPGPVEVQLVNETPKIDRGSVLVNFMTMGPTNTVLCELGDYTVVEDCKSVHNYYVVYVDKIITFKYRTQELFRVFKYSRTLFKGIS